jgi:hypothetical protein
MTVTRKRRDRRVCRVTNDSIYDGVIGANDGKLGHVRDFGGILNDTICTPNRRIEDMMGVFARSAEK